jgi:DNA-binding MarR family transcriptional regulator
MIECDYQILTSRTVLQQDMRGRFINIKGVRVRVTRAGERLAQVLSESPELSHREIAAQLGVSRAAVTQSLRTLRDRAIRALASRPAA